MKVLNPYSEMIELMKKHGAALNPPVIQLGQVISSNPLAVETSGLQLNKSNLLVADYLTENYTRAFTADEVTAIELTENKTIRGINISDGKLSLKNGLKSNDMVALIQIDNATFLILCKVVNA